MKGFSTTKVSTCLEMLSQCPRLCTAVSCEQERGHSYTATALGRDTPFKLLPGEDSGASFLL